MLFIAEVLHRELGDDKYRPPTLLQNLVAAGWFGKKTGRGLLHVRRQGEPHRKERVIMSVSLETILVAREGHIATITLNRPDKLNAINATLLRELFHAVVELGADKTVALRASSPARATRRSRPAPTSAR